MRQKFSGWHNLIGYSVGMAGWSIIMIAGLTIFGKDQGNDLGIRLSAWFGLVACLIAAFSFLKFRE